MTWQVELHPKWRQDALLAACAALGTHVTAYSPLGSPDSAKMIKHDGASVMAAPAVTRVAQAVGKSPAQVLVRWAVQRGTSVIPKSVCASRATHRVAHRPSINVMHAVVVGVKVAGSVNGRVFHEKGKQLIGLKDYDEHTSYS